MIQSMTAFARSEAQGTWGSLVCECRSINHRYLETNIRMPDTFHELEALMRERIRHHVKRGKVECFLRFQAADHTSLELSINHDVLKKLIHTNQVIADNLNNPGTLSTMDLLQWPGVLQVKDVDMEAIKEAVLQTLETTLIDLVEARHREGETLKQLFNQRLDIMSIELDKVRKKLPTIMQHQRDRLIARFTDANLQLDAARLEQELVMFAQKIDVTEEVDRLETHINEVRRVLKHGGAMGRRLDFLMQELNREANTLGSKSVDTDTTLASVELKVLIEQVREQVQNVE